MRTPDKLRLVTLAGACGWLLLLAGHELPAQANTDSVAKVLWQPSMNMFRRHTVPAEAMFEFYGEVLGLEQLATRTAGSGSGVARFRVGDSELRLTGIAAGRNYVPGGVQDATGLRLLGFFFDDRNALVERFVAHGLAAPEFELLPGRREPSALVQDPDGQWVELLLRTAGPADSPMHIEVGLTVSDLARSRSFYRDFVGLQELPPAADPRFDTQQYSYRHGSTLVTLRSFGPGIPADTGSGGIQYVVSDVDHVDATAKRQDVTIDQPLRNFGNSGTRMIWVEDPDGITNYFTETAESRSEPAP